MRFKEIIYGSLNILKKFTHTFLLFLKSIEISQMTSKYSTITNYICWTIFIKKYQQNDEKN